VVLAEATKTALERVNEAIQDKELPAMYLLGEKYIEAIHSMSKSENSKLVLLPADIPAAVRGIMSNAK
jgi:regulator of protease activity HflC (stomatin/prohibitin superfamily)